MARTVAAVGTYSRYSLLKLQVRTLLRETVDISPEHLAKVDAGLNDPFYIQTIFVRGLFSNNEIGCELKLSIDWRQHKLAIVAGGSEIQAPSSWSGGVAPSVQEGSKTFLEACKIAGLKREWVVSYDPRFDREAVNRLLGFRGAAIRTWAREPDRMELGLGPLSEGKLSIAIAID